MSMSDPAFTGVEGQVSILLGYSGGRQAVLNTSLRGRSPIRADIVGTEARIEIDSVWYAPSHFTVIDRDGGRERFEFPHTGHGLRHQAAEVARCVSDGRLESELMPLDETVSIMQLMDEIRSQGGYRLPGDSDSASMSASEPAS
jgi:predicted dehydrogenase